MWHTLPFCEWTANWSDRLYCLVKGLLTDLTYLILPWKDHRLKWQTLSWLKWHTLSFCERTTDWNDVPYRSVKGPLTEMTDFIILWKDHWLKWQTLSACERMTDYLKQDKTFFKLKVSCLLDQTGHTLCVLQAANFFWGLWALIQAKNSTTDFDFVGWVMDCLIQL